MGALFEERQIGGGNGNARHFFEEVERPGIQFRAAIGWAGKAVLPGLHNEAARHAQFDIPAGDPALPWRLSPCRRVLPSWGMAGHQAVRVGAGLFRPRGTR